MTKITSQGWTYHWNYESITGSDANQCWVPDTRSSCRDLHMCSSRWHHFPFPVIIWRITTEMIKVSINTVIDSFQETCIDLILKKVYIKMQLYQINVGFFYLMQINAIGWSLLEGVEISGNIWPFFNIYFIFIYLNKMVIYLHLGSFYCKHLYKWGLGFNFVNGTFGQEHHIWLI